MNRWEKFWQPSKKWWMLGLPVGAIAAVFAGIVFWGGFNWSMEATSSEKFCISCHEMDAAYQEYTDTTHFKNAAGVKASCPDCHVPKPWVHKVVRKIKASTEVWHTMLGTIDTPEKYEEHRLRMAKKVWAEMKASDSRECRNCHNFKDMDLEAQEKRARRKHDAVRIAESGETCIDCHQGIAHDMPKEDFD